MRVLKKGSSAYLDSFSGLVACKVLRVYKERFSTVADVVVTADLGAYRKGEELIARPTSRVVPKDCIRKTTYSTLIGFYTVLTDEEVVNGRS